MNALNLALRAAPMFLTEADPTKLSVTDVTLFADALSNGIADYWSGAPAWVTTPQGEDPLSTVAGTATVALPTHFQTFQREPWIRASSNELWVPLQDMKNDPDDGGTAQGRPTHFRVINNSTAPVWSDASNDPPGSNAGNGPPSPLLQLWPTPDAVYSINVWCSYFSPRIRLKHLSGAPATITLPIPEDHLLRIVLPLCGPHMITHPLVKTDRITAFMTAAQAAMKALADLPQYRTTGNGRVGTKLGF